MEIVSDDFEAQARQVFTNLQAVCEEAAGSLGDIVKLNLYLVDFDNFIWGDGRGFSTPFPARAAVEKASKGS